MYLSFRSVLFLIIVGAGWAHAQHIATLEHAKRVIKSENGFIIAWTPVTQDNKNANQVDIFDEGGRVVASVNVFRPAPEARLVGIADVSVRSGMVAVAASYASKDRKVHPAFSLLIFDFSGHLVSAFVLEPWRQIFQLAIDDQSNIWTLTANSIGRDPATTPLVVEYATTGAILRQLLPRSLFPLHARMIKESPSTGKTGMGYDSGYIWFWLPGSTDLVTVSVSDGKSSMTKTWLPTRANHTEVPLTVARESSGDLAAQFREDGDSETNLAYYRWSSSTKSWSQFKPGACDGDWLIGAGGPTQLYSRRKSDRVDICSFSKP